MKTTLLGILLALLLCPAALAGGWTITYNASGGDRDSQGYYPWPAHPTALASDWNFVSLGHFVIGSTSEVTSSGTLRAVLHWNPSSPSDVPPSKINILISSYVAAMPGASGRNQVYNGFSDPPEMHDPMMCTIHKGGDYSRTLSVPPGATVVYTPPIQVRATVPVEPGQPSLASTSISFRVSVIDINIEGTSTAGESGSPPPYFSGTNCRVVGSTGLPPYTETMMDGPTGFQSAQLLIGGVVVNSVEFDGPGYPKGVELKARFDSTHFGDGSDIPITFQATDDLGMTYTLTRSAPAKNRALILASQTLKFAQRTTETVAGHVSGTNHFTIRRNNVSKMEIITPPLLGPFTVFHTTTHANDGPAFFDCLNYPEGTDDQTILNQYIVSSGDIKLDLLKTDWPPPFNFVFLDACNTAGDELSFHRPFFHLAHDFLGPSVSTDRCFLGWGHKVRDDRKSSKWVGRLYSALASGDSVQGAIVAADIVEPMYGNKNPDGGTWFWNYGPIEPYIFGDTQTKLHGVYGQRGLTWYSVAEALL